MVVRPGAKAEGRGRHIVSSYPDCDRSWSIRMRAKSCIDFMERMQAVEAEMGSLRWNEKSFEMMECRK
jgi:hypothetical protein